MYKPDLIPNLKPSKLHKIIKKHFSKTLNNYLLCYNTRDHLGN